MLPETKERLKSALITYGIPLTVFTILWTILAVYIGSPIIQGDGLTYLSSALRTLNTGVYSFNNLDPSAVTQPDAFAPPGWPGLLIALYSFLPRATDLYHVISSTAPFWLALNYVIIGVTILAMTEIGNIIGKRQLALTTGIMTACFVPLLMTGFSLMPEQLGFMLLVVFSLACLKLLGRRDSHIPWWGWAILAGIIFGWQLLTRTALIPWMLFAGICTLIARCRRDADLARVFLIFGVVLGCALVVWAPWAARNYQVFDEFIPVTTHSGTVWLDSVGGLSSVTEEDYPLLEEASSQGKDPYKELAFARMRKMYQENAWGFVSDRIGQGVMAAIAPPVSLATIESGSEYERAVEGWELPSGARLTASRLQVLQYASRIIQGAIFVCAVVGVLIYRKQVLVWVALSLSVYVWVMQTVIFAIPRYMLMLWPSLIVLGALGFLAIRKKIESLGKSAA